MGNRDENGPSEHCVLNPAPLLLPYRRISQYSPSDTSKQYEKSVSKKSTAKFNPKSILKRLKEEPEQDLGSVEDLRPKIDLINQYLNVSFRLLVIAAPDHKYCEDIMCWSFLHLDT